jgi:hypothetical protein
LLADFGEGLGWGACRQERQEEQKAIESAQLGSLQRVIRNAKAPTRGRLGQAFRGGAGEESHPEA